MFSNGPVMSRLIFALVFLLAACAPKDAAVQDDQSVFDFGVVMQDAKVEHAFHLTNTGKDKLLIEKVKTSCGCTAARLDKNELAPGESTEIKVVFNTRARRGPQEKKITVMTSDPARPQVVFTLKGEIFERISFDPPRLLIKGIQENQPETRTVTLINNGSKPLTVTDVRPAPGFEKCLAAKVESADGAALPATLKEKERMTFLLSVMPQEEKNASRCVLEVLSQEEEPIAYKVIIWRKKS